MMGNVTWNITKVVYSMLITYYIYGYITKVVYSMLYHMVCNSSRFARWWNPFLTWGSPGTSSTAASSIPVTRPGHDFDCAQAPMRLVACRGAGIVTCCRLVVSKI